MGSEKRRSISPSSSASWIQTPAPVPHNPTFLFILPHCPGEQRQPSACLTFSVCRWAGKRFDSSAEDAICLEKARGPGPTAQASGMGLSAGIQR